MKQTIKTSSCETLVIDSTYGILNISAYDPEGYRGNLEITPKQLDRLALESSLVKKMKKFIEEETTYYNDGKKLLAAIAELEQQG